MRRDRLVTFVCVAVLAAAAAAVSWLRLRFWMEVVFFRLAFGLGTVAAVSLGLEETVSGLCNAALGFLLFAMPGAAPTRVTVLQPLGALVNALDYGLIIPALLVILGFLVAGATVSSVVDAVSERRIRAEEHNKLTERSLQAATDRMHLAAAAADIGFWTRDLVAETEEWDDNMLRIYGVSRAAFDGRWEPFLHPDDRERARDEAQRAIDEGRRGEYVFRIVRPDGTVRHLKGMSQVLRDARGRPTLDIGVDIDITRQVQADEALAAAREQERRRDEAHRQELETKLKTSLNAAAVAHEINQPLSCLLLRARLGLETATGGDHDTLSGVVADAAFRIRFPRVAAS